MVGQIQALVTVTDLGTQQPDGKFQVYHGALIDVLPFKNNGIPHEAHGMIEVISNEIKQPGKGRRLMGRRLYTLPMVLRSAHLVPAYISLGKPISTKGSIYYINNYIDWD
jgi:hypothetical protein